MKTPPPLVSVVIPCYNTTKYIPEALDSLRKQTFRNFEAIVVNDGCPDTENLEKALEPYRNEIVYLKPGRGGVSAARNAAIQTSKAKYVALLDSDDFWEPTYLEVQIGILEADPTADVVYPNSVYFGDSPWAGRKGMDVSPSDGEVTVEALLTERCHVCVSLAARRESLIRAGLFDPKIKNGEDFDLWVRVLQSGGRIVYHRQVLIHYRLRQNSATDDKLDHLKNGLIVYEKHARNTALPAGQRVLFETAIRRQKAEMDLFRGKKAIYAGDRAKALELLNRANAVAPSRRIQFALWALRFAPGLLFKYIHRRYPTEYIYLH